MTIVQLYHIVLERIQQLMPHERITRIRNLAWLQAGIVLSLVLLATSLVVLVSMRDRWLSALS